ncbi:MAG TPA: hypothetical protein VES67_05880 [Vicinamibacterales bacterium]|nr:hypothetical protein [Vicinamibacterales bacterium]
MATHLKVTAVLFILVGVVLICMAFLMSLLFGVLGGVVGASGEENAGWAVAVLGLSGAALTIMLLVLGVPYIICGWGLYRRRRWARVMGIILAAIALTKIPIGTAIGIYALIILFQKDTEALLT